MTVCPLSIGVADPELPCFSPTGSGHGQASSSSRDGTSHIPRESKKGFPGDQSGEATPVTCGGPMPVCTGRSLGTKTLSARPPLVHACSAPESQVGDGCSKIPCFQSITGSGHNQAALSVRDGNNHISRESRPARKYGWTTPQKAAASSMRREPRNTSCAADRVSRNGSPADKSGQALSESCCGPSDFLGPISGIQEGKDMPGLLPLKNENGEFVTGKTKKRHWVENKRRRKTMADKMADTRRTPCTAARRWRPGRRAPRTGRRTPRAAGRYKKPLPEGGGPPAEPGGRINAKL